MLIAEKHIAATAPDVIDVPLQADTSTPTASERAARAALRRQISKLEHEISELVARGFPHLFPPETASHSPQQPHLLTLMELEEARDQLVGQLSELRAAAVARARFECGARALLEAMKQDPARYKFRRLPLADLGEGRCGFWEVRPRCGLIGMLAGWWELKLSSGCPLPRAAPRRGRTVDLHSPNVAYRGRPRWRRWGLRLAMARCLGLMGCRAWM